MATSQSFTPRSASVRFGVGRRDITPPVGIYARQWGAAAHDAAEGVHRQLYATVAAFAGDDGGDPLVLATFDGGWWQNLSDEQRVRQALLDVMQLNPSRLLLALSHTHAACSLCTDDTDKPGGHLIEPYLKQITAALIEAAREAVGDMRAAVVTWGTGRCDLAANRDFPDPDVNRVLCGYHPDGPADDAVIVGRVTDAADDRVLATIVNYACHPTTLAWDNRLVSPDYIGAMCETVERHTSGAPCLFLQGASGELGPREGFTGDVAIADANGRRLGSAVVATLESMLRPGMRLAYAGVVESGAPIATWRREPFDPPNQLSADQIEIELPLKPLPPVDEIEKALENCPDRVQAERLRRKLRLLRKVGSGATYSMPTWFWRIGRAVLVAHPNECYSVFQTTLRERFGEWVIPVVTVVNGGIGYLSPPELHEKDLYQVWQSPFDRGALPTLIDACLSHIDQLTRDG